MFETLTANPLLWKAAGCISLSANISANNAAGVRDLASGGRLNGSEQTAGAGEQTQQPHQKAKGREPTRSGGRTDAQDSVDRCRTAKKRKEISTQEKKDC